MFRAWAFAFLLLASCTHTIDLRGFDHGLVPYPTVRDKKIAIVLDPEAIQDNHDVSTDVYKFQFRHITPAVTESLRNRLGIGAAVADIIPVAQIKDRAKNYDYLVYPALSIRTVHDFWTLGCLIKYRLAIKNREGKVVTDESGEGKRNFFDENQVEKKCKIAMTEVFDKVNDRALAFLNNPAPSKK